MKPEGQNDSDILPAHVHCDGDKVYLCVLLCCTCACRFNAWLRDISSVFKNKFLFFFFFYFVLGNQIIRMHGAGRPAERNLQLVTFSNREQRELRKNGENYGWILAWLPP